MKDKAKDRTELCILCGREYATHTHHLITGSHELVIIWDTGEKAGRSFSERFGLTIDIYPSCHNGAVLPEDRIHGNPRAEDLSKMLGQAIWGRNYYKDLFYQLNRGHDEARDSFIQMNGRSYL